MTLNEKNNWRYTWRDLDAGHSWKVVEQTVPDGYTVSISREGITFVITNSYEDDRADTPEPTSLPTPTPTPTPTSTPTPKPTPTLKPVPTPTPTWSPDQPDTPDQPDDWTGDGGEQDTDTPKATETPEQPGLPQTGTLSWPVPVLACGGMLLFLAGWIRSRKE